MKLMHLVKSINYCELVKPINQQLSSLIHGQINMMKFVESNKFGDTAKFETFWFDQIFEYVLIHQISLVKNIQSKC